MSDDRPVPPLPEGVVPQELLEKIGGGQCTIEDYQLALTHAKETYEALIDFTSYVIERVGGP